MSTFLSSLPHRIRIPRLPVHQAWILLWISCLGSLAVYAFLIVRPTLLSENYANPRIDLIAMIKVDPGVQTRLVIAIFLLAVFYAAGWMAARSLRGKSAWTVILVSALAAAAILLFVYPFDATDLFDYIARGRLTGIYGANPYRDLVSQFPQDIWSRYAGWPDYPSPYGPLWELAAAGVARLAGDGIVQNVIAFKLLSGAFIALAVACAGAILRKMAPERALAGVYLLAWNPLLLYESFGHGHNDMAMLAWVLVASWAIIHERHLLGILALIIGGLFKFIPLLLMPVALMIALRKLPTPLSRIRFIMIAGIGSGLVVAAAYAPFWVGPQTLTFQRQAQLLTTSLPSLIFHALEGDLGELAAGTWVSQVGLMLTGLFAVGQAARSEMDHSWLCFPRASAIILLFYLFVSAAWIQPWYFIWPVALAILIPPGPLWGVALYSSFAILSKSLVVAPVVFYWLPGKTDAIIELGLTLGVLLVPWLTGIAAIAWRTFQSRRVRTLSP